MWNLKYDTNELNNKIETQIEQTYHCQEDGEGWSGNQGLVDANYYI